jgi:tripartite-type tricarboxylate transporter receptor subunit TctC
MEGVEWFGWFGVFVPAGTPTEIVSGLNASVRTALVGEALKMGLEKQSFEPTGCTPAELALLVKSDLESWADTVKASGFKPID